MKRAVFFWIGLFIYVFLLTGCTQGGCYRPSYIISDVEKGEYIEADPQDKLP